MWTSKKLRSFLAIGSALLLGAAMAWPIGNSSSTNKAAGGRLAKEQSIHTKYIRGCSICCCKVRVPSEASTEDSLRYCLRSHDRVCAKMCKEWLRERRHKS